MGSWLLCQLPIHLYPYRRLKQIAPKNKMVPEINSGIVSEKENE